MSKAFQLAETAKVLESSASKPGHKLVQLISPGWGSSGFYSSTVLESAVTDGIFPAGIHQYADHPTEVEAVERPGRSIKDLVSVTVTEGRLATDADIAAGADAGAVVAETKIAAPFRDLIEDLGDSIGLSVLGDATDITVGEAEGRSGRIIEGLAHIVSVDWVTRAGRGGKVLSLLESARVNHRARSRGVAEATVNDTREALQTVLRDAYGGDKVYLWVRDFDESTVWFEIEDGDDSGVFGQPYTSSDSDDVALTGDRTEVRVSTTYVPVSPAGPSTTESEEDTMSNHSIEEAERLLTEATGRVTALEERATTAERERDEARGENARLNAREAAVTHARTRVTEGNAGLPAATVDRIVAQATATVTLTEAGQLDTAALDTAVDTARTAEETYLAGLAESAGIGSITGFGGTPAGDPPAITEADIDTHVGGAFGRTQIGA